MCESQEKLQQSYEEYRLQLIDAGLLLESGVNGVYGLSGDFEQVIEAFEQLITTKGKTLKTEVIRFPPLLNRQTYLSTDHIETMPNLMGSIHTFQGSQRDHLRLMQKKHAGDDWTTELEPTEVMMTPAACYPLYPTAANSVLPKDGRIVDLRAFVYRHEPSPDPARMQIFRQREFVRLGTPAQALAHRDYWLDESFELLSSLGLKVEKVIANDPFFGRGGRVMAATQKEQALKFEIVVPVASTEKLTAVASSNCHLDHFGKEFNIKTEDGHCAHTSCIGFGLERVALALFKQHGLDLNTWSLEVRDVLRL